MKKFLLPIATHLHHHLYQMGGVDIALGLDGSLERINKLKFLKTIIRELETDIEVIRIDIRYNEDYITFLQNYKKSIDEEYRDSFNSYFISKFINSYHI